MPDAPPSRTSPAPRERPSPADADAPCAGIDERERQDWFRRMPPDAQEEMRHRWAEAGDRAVRRRHLARSTRTRSMAQGALLLFFTETFCAMPSWAPSLAAAAAGVALGELWHRIGANRFRCMATSVLPYAVLRIAFPGDSPIAAKVFAVLGLPMLLGLAAGIGFDRERRRAENLDY